MTSALKIAGRSISQLIFGCEQLGGTDWGAVDQAEAAAAVRAALDCGINAFDVADVYGLGRAEAELTKSLGDQLHTVTVMTKGGVRWWPSTQGRARTAADGSPEYLSRAVKDSLARLRLESIPIYFLHRVDPAVPVEESVGTLSELVSHGLIQAVGLCNVPLAVIRRAHAVYPISAVQLEYNLIRRDAETDVIPGCVELGIAVVAHSPLAQGLLTGKYGADSRFDETDRRHRHPAFAELARGDHRSTLEMLRKIAAELGATPAQIALRWVLDQKGIAGVIVGAKSPAQVHDNAGAMHLQLDHMR